MEGAPPDEKYVLHFNEVEKPLVLNSTNGQLIAQITGNEDFDAWIGSKLVLYNDPSISFAGKITGGIRVRKPKQASAPAQSASATKPAAQPETDDSSDVPF